MLRVNRTLYIYICGDADAEMRVGSHSLSAFVFEVMLNFDTNANITERV